MLKKRNNQSGQIFILALIILGLVLINTVVIISGSLTFFESSTNGLQRLQAVNLAEAGIDKAVASLNSSAGSYNGESETFLGTGSFSVSVTSINATTLLVTSTGYVPDKANYKARKTIQIQISKGTGFSFSYGMQVGVGGIQMGNNSILNGSIYSNGNITGGNGSLVTGDVYVAGGTQPTADQSSDCTDPNCADFLFGTSVNGNNQLDAAQSFQLSTSGVLNKISLKLKKIGSPANPTVYILGNKNGLPDKNNIIVSGTLLSNLVGTNYGFIDVTFSSSVNLSANTPYWIVVAPQSLDSANYFAWSEDILQGYSKGSPDWSTNWSASSPVWNSIPADLGFEVYLGGVNTYVDLSGGGVNGNVHANTIKNLTVGKDAYYQTLVNSTVKGTSYPGSADPPPTVFPISASNINDWQNQATAMGVSTGDINGCPSKLGPGKIVGNVTLSNNCSLTLESPVWITGNFYIGNSPVISLDSGYQGSSGLIMVDGQTTFSNGASLNGSGTSGSTVMLLSTYNSSTLDAINTGNGAVSGILCAPYGIVDLPNGASFQEITANLVKLGNNGSLSYQTGMSSVFFSSGPTGAFSVIKGTYQIK